MTTAFVEKRKKQVRLPKHQEDSSTGTCAALPEHPREALCSESCSLKEHARESFVTTHADRPSMSTSTITSSFYHKLMNSYATRDIGDRSAHEKTYCIDLMLTSDIFNPAIVK